ncbi:MAG: hypothetical protein CL490_15230 [Acinetobacter sp.]|nr:hypothetical protein [Acinetobacter sp.]
MHKMYRFSPYFPECINFLIVSDAVSSIKSLKTTKNRIKLTLSISLIIPESEAFYNISQTHYKHDLMGNIFKLKKI